MIERATISSVAQFAAFAKQYPAILNIGSLVLLKEPITKINNSPHKGCNCAKKAGAVDLTIYRPQFEAAMTMLSVDEKQKLKTILDAQKVCYYVKNDKGQIKQLCF